MPLLDAALDKAVTVPSASIHAHVASVRRRNPGADPQHVVRLLEREYLTVVAATGGAVGVAAAAPSVGTGVATALTVSDVATFFGASAAFALAVASVHGIEVDDAERRKALLMATLLGEPGAAVVSDAAGITTVRVARTLLTRLPLGTVRRVNAQLAKRLVKRQVVKQSSLALGRLAPFGIGLLIGVAGGRALGRTVVAGARTAFGPAPDRFDRTIETWPTPPALPADPA